MNRKMPLPAANRVLLALTVVWASAVCDARQSTESTRDVSTGNIVAIGTTRDPLQRDYTPAFLADRLGMAQRMSKLTGVAVRDQAGHKLGKFQDLIVDLSSGRILCALVSAGGAADVAVPPKAFSAIGENGALVEFNQPTFANAPHFAIASDNALLVNSLPQSYAFFGQRLAGTDRLNPARIRKSSSLTGVNVKNKADESLGSVVNLLVDVPTARVVFVVVSFTGLGSDLYAVPPSALQPGPDSRTLVLNGDRAKIASLAQSDGFFWSNLTDPTVGLAAYREFGQTADFDPAADPAREQVRAKVAETPAAAPAAPRSDHDLERDILIAMMNDNPHNALTFKKVSIRCANGQVFLTGRVKNEELKAKLTAIIAKVVGAANVQDQMEIK